MKGLRILDGPRRPAATAVWRSSRGPRELRILLVGGRPPDGVVEQAPPRTQLAPERADVGLDGAAPHVLEHPDGADRVEGAVVEVPVVLDPEVHEAAHPCRLRPGRCHGPLGLRQRDADHLAAVGARSVDGHRTPPAAHVEEAHALGELELAGDQVQLAQLGDLERLVGLREHGAGVDHRGSEDLGVEGVGHVVVVGHGLAVALGCAAPRGASPRWPAAGAA